MNNPGERGPAKGADGLSLAAKFRHWSASRWSAFAICLLFTLALVRNCVFPLGGIWYVNGSVLDDPAHSVWSLWHLCESITAGHNPYRAQDIFFPVGARLIHPTVAEG